MISDYVVDLSRLQFALTALYHFLFVPLTLGMSFMLAIMESVYVMTGKQVYKDMTRFWGKLFGINFALGVATGLTMEFQFGTNWSYYSHYVGDIFGAPLAIEALMAFFLESTFVGMFFFGWDRMSRVQHLACTWLVAIGSNISALWILIANGWMQNPVGAEFNFETMRMEMVDFAEVIFQPHRPGEICSHCRIRIYNSSHVCTVYQCLLYADQPGYRLCPPLFCRGIRFRYGRHSLHYSCWVMNLVITWVMCSRSSWQRLRQSGTPRKPPPPFTLIGIPDQENMETDFAIKIPWAMGIIATRSLDKAGAGYSWT